jgi:hypothetical protein
MIRNLLIVLFLLSIYGITAQSTFMQSYPDTINKQRLYTCIGTELGSYAAGLSFLSFIWYKDHERVPFHYYNDSRGYLQMDKFGHAYGAYRESYAAYHALRWAGVDKNRALLYGGPIGLIFQTPIELFDGMYEGWGFSWPDMLANTFGAALFTSQELIFDEQIFLMKFSYYPSIYPDYHTHLGETAIENFFLDYNGHTYWLSGDLHKLTGIDAIPEWLNIAFGYSANGMIYEFHNPEWYNGQAFPELKRYRQFLFSLDINLSKVKTRKKYLQKVLRAANLIKIPFPALEFNGVNGPRFYPMYF